MFCPCPEAVTYSQRPGVSLALCCMLGQTLQRFCPCREAITHRQRPGVSLALYCMSGQTLHRFCPCPEAITHRQRPGVSLALCCMSGQTLQRFCPCPEAVTHRQWPDVSLALCPALRLPPWWRILLVLKIASGSVDGRSIVGITTAVPDAVHKTENVGLPGPHPFPERWTTWGRSRQDHPTSRGPIPFAARVV